MRLQKEVLQIDLAINTGLPVRTIQNYEAGLSMPNAINAQLLAEALNTTVEKLFPLSPIPPATQ